MILTLTGLSGCGKSHLAQRLVKEKGFLRFCCDDLIEEQLAAELQQTGASGIHGVAGWMGEPYEEGYAEREGRYLACEKSVMASILRLLEETRFKKDENVVIDTSGSVVYTGQDVLEALRRRTKVIYLAVPRCEYEFMYQQYFQDTKPVIWGGNFHRLPGQDPKEALRESYRTLIHERSERYARFAHVTVIMDRQSRDRFTTRRLLQAVGVI